MVMPVCLQLMQYSYCLLIFHNLHFVQQPGTRCILMDNEEYVADIYIDTALFLLFESNIATEGFPVTIERTTDKVTFSVEDRASGITTRNIVVCNEGYR